MMAATSIVSMGTGTPADVLLRRDAIFAISLAVRMLANPRSGWAARATQPERG